MQAEITFCVNDVMKISALQFSVLLLRDRTHYINDFGVETTEF